MLKTIISGGQSGCDIAGWKAAKLSGINTSGWMPRSFLTEDGPCPHYATHYNAREHPAPDYPARRRANLSLTASLGGRENGLAVVFDATPRGSNNNMSAGTRGLFNDYNNMLDNDQPCPAITLVRLVPKGESFSITSTSHDPAGLAWAIGHCEADALLVAGNRESKAVGIEKFVMEFLVETFRLVLSERTSTRQ